MSASSWYDPGTSRHLHDDEIVALASGRWDQVSPLASQHYIECDDCQRAVVRYEKSAWNGESGGVHPFRGRNEEEIEEPAFTLRSAVQPAGALDWSTARTHAASVMTVAMRLCAPFRLTAIIVMVLALSLQTKSSTSKHAHPLNRVGIFNLKN